MENDGAHSRRELKGKLFRTEGCGPLTDESAPDARAGGIDRLSSVSLLPFCFDPSLCHSRRWAQEATQFVVDTN